MSSSGTCCAERGLGGWKGCGDGGAVDSLAKLTPCTAFPNEQHARRWPGSSSGRTACRAYPACKLGCVPGNALPEPTKAHLHPRHPPPPGLPTPATTTVHPPGPLPPPPAARSSAGRRRRRPCSGPWPSSSPRTAAMAACGVIVQREMLSHNLVRQCRLAGGNAGSKQRADLPDPTGAMLAWPRGLGPAAEPRMLSVSTSTATSSKATHNDLRRGDSGGRCHLGARSALDRGFRGVQRTLLQMWSAAIEAIRAEGGRSGVRRWRGWRSRVSRSVCEPGKTAITLRYITHHRKQPVSGRSAAAAR